MKRLIALFLLCVIAAPLFCAKQHVGSLRLDELYFDTDTGKYTVPAMAIGTNSESVAISSASAISRLKYCIERPTATATNIVLLSPSAAMTITKCVILISTNNAEGLSPTIDVKLQRANANGLVPSDISFTVYSAAAGVQYSTTSFIAATNSIGPAHSLNINLSNPANFEEDNDFLLIDIWMKEQ